MLRGLDLRDERDAPPIVKVEDRAEIHGDVTVYLRSSAPDVARDRQRAVLELIECLEGANVLEDVPIVRWPDRVHTPSDPDSEAAVACYDEFVDAVGSGALEPFFEERPATGSTQRVIVFPVICIAIRDRGELTGLYPHWSDGVHHSIERCLDALSAGAPVENVVA